MSLRASLCSSKMVVCLDFMLSVDGQLIWCRVNSDATLLFLYTSYLLFHGTVDDQIMRNVIY